MFVLVMYRHSSTQLQTQILKVFIFFNIQDQLIAGKNNLWLFHYRIQFDFSNSANWSKL